MSSWLASIGGLPTHPLLVHLPVVLVPLAAILAIVIAARASWDRRIGGVVVLIALGGALSSLLAKESGEQLARRLGNPIDHAHWGSRLPLIAGALFLSVLILWLFDRGIPGNRRRPWWLVLLAVVVIVVAVVALWWTWRTGDSGARSVWEPLMRRGSP